MLDHVTGRCSLSSPVMVTSSNSIWAKIYGPWIWAEHAGSLLFINLIKEEKRHEGAKKGKAIQNAIAFQNGLCYSGVKLGQSSLIDNLDKKNPDAELQAARNMCPELDTLHVTLNGQVLF